ncbi:MAG: hypothetical protein B7X67_26525, partial [Rhizobiales bacterium 39-66-18]
MTEAVETRGRASAANSGLAALAASTHRRGELRLVLLAAVVGILSGAVAMAISSGAKWMHAILFGAGTDGMLSRLPSLSQPYMYLIPAVGGLAIGLLAWIVRKVRPGGIRDPIEANALHGGRMSLLDSAILSVQVMLCNGFGASVGMEAGYSQAGAG